MTGSYKTLGLLRVCFYGDSALASHIQSKETSIHALQHLFYPRLEIVLKRMAPIWWPRSLFHWSYLDMANVLL